MFLPKLLRNTHTAPFGARQLVARLDALGIVHRYEEFDDDHSGIDYRLDVSLPWLYEIISA